MAGTTGIAWTDATFNPWIGCTKVGRGCDHCYAETANLRFAGGANWGPGAPRRRTSEGNWNQPRKWNRYRAEGRRWLKEPVDCAYCKDAEIQPADCGHLGQTIRPGVPVPLWVFCASHADVFDNEVPNEWRADLWKLIRETPHLRWQLVTKRVGNVAKMLPQDWFTKDPPPPGHAYRHVGVIATMVDQEEWDRDVDKLIGLKAIGVRWIGASVEPMLGPILAAGSLALLDWVICGGESIQRGEVRYFNLPWAYSLLEQCRAAGVPFFMKQIGSLVMHSYAPGPFVPPWRPKDRAGKDPAEWPEDLRVREMPRVYGDAS